ncbi:unnamed protein product [Calypogeia fissa]
MALLTPSLLHPLVLRCPTNAGSSCCSSSSSSSSVIGVRAAGVNHGNIGSRRKKGGGSRPGQSTEPPVENKRSEPFLQTYLRTFREEGHQSLDDAELLLSKASNPYGLVLRIAEEATEYLRNNKEESLRRKPILKVISDRINEMYGEELRDSYINEKEDYQSFVE